MPHVSPMVPDGIDRFDDPSSRIAAVQCINAVDQLLMVAQLSRSAQVFVFTEKAALRCLYDLDHSFNTAGYYHACASDVELQNRDDRACAFDVARRVRAEVRAALHAYKSDGSASAEGWTTLPESYTQQFGDSPVPTWNDVQSELKEVDSDAQGLLCSARLFIPELAKNPPWHFGAWSLICERLKVFSRDELTGLTKRLIAVVESEPGQNAPDSPPAKNPQFSLLDRYPESSAGHVAFLEFVLDEVGYSAEAKRQQLARGYTNDTLANMVSGIKWAEARQRIAALSDFPADTVREVARVLRRELTVGTVEQIHELLTPTVRGLRNAWENLDAGLTDEVTADDATRPTIDVNETGAGPQGAGGLFGQLAESIRAAIENPESRQRWQQCIEEISRRKTAARDELAARHFPEPESIEDWVHLARIVEIPPESIDKLTATDIFDAAMAWADRQQIKARLVAETNAAVKGGAPAEPASDPRTLKKPKRSTERGEARIKLISALTKHHEYADGGCLKLEPIGNNELARLAGVDQATASAFFQQQFKGHGKYKAVCGDVATLIAALKILNGEFSPHLLYGAKPPDEDDRDEE